MLSRIVTQHLLREAARWKTLPPGWTSKSRKKMWETLGGTGKKKVTHCMKTMEGKVDNPGAFCAALRDRVEGPEWRQRKK